jgi:uncharacterized membrane protein YkvA (DUF1232 family)
MSTTRRRHPMVRLAGTLARLPRYLNLAQRLVRDPAVSPARKAALGLGIGYVALPFDLIPGVIPVLGQLDDLSALLLGLRAALHGCPQEAAEAHLSAAGLSQSALDADVRTVEVAGVWLIVETATLAVRAVTLPARALAGFVPRRRKAAEDSPPAAAEPHSD